MSSSPDSETVTKKDRTAGALDTETASKISSEPRHAAIGSGVPGGDASFLKSKSHVFDSFLEMIKDRRALLITFFASIGGFLFGYDQGVVSNILILESFGATFPRVYSDADFKGWTVSSLLLAAWFGSLVVSYPTDKIGRKRTISLSCIVFTIGSALQAGAISSGMLIAGRVIAGVAVGALTAVVPLLLAELAPSHIRGGLVAIQQLSITLGILVSYWLAFGTSYIGGHDCAPGQIKSGPPERPGGAATFDPYLDVPEGGCTGQSDASWRVPLAFQIVPALILGFGTEWVLPFSPRWLVDQGRTEEALNVLAHLRNLDASTPSVRKEWLDVRAAASYGKEVWQAKQQSIYDQHGRSGLKSWLLVKTAKYTELVTVRANFKRVFIGSAIMFFQQFIGCNAIIYYAPTIFSQLGMSGTTNSILATGVYGIVNTVSTLPAVFFVDVVGRRPLLMLGAIGTMSSLLIVGGLVAGYGDTLGDAKHAGKAAIAFIYIYDVFFSFSWAPIGWIYPSEIFPLRVRAPAISITTSSTWMSNFIVGQVTPSMIDNLGFGTYIFYAAFALVALIFVFFFVPETRGRTLEEMSVVFGAKADEAKEEVTRLEAILTELQVEDGSRLD